MNAKKNLYILFAAAAVFAACTETTEIDPEEYVYPMYLDVSGDKVVFDREGGKTAVAVATNADDWNFAVSGDWFTAESDENGFLVISAPSNYSPDSRTGSVDITATRGEEVLSCSVSVAQRTDRSVNLNTEGTANCYLVQTGTTYTFDATVKGNGGSDGRSHYIETCGLEITGIAYADLLWEARTDGDKSMSKEIIDGLPVYNDGYVTFTTGRMEGNALIAVKDYEGKVLWSWHIWVCDDEIEVHDHINPRDEVTGQIMDRNLGAMNNTPMDVGNKGMFYQWGRKDPFMPSKSPYYTDADSGNVPEYNQTNLEVGDGSGEWLFSEDYKAQLLSTPPANIPYSVENPMMFLRPYSGSGGQHWYVASMSDEARMSSLWSGEEKTIFDPCPVGYKVPGENFYGIASELDVNSYPTGGAAEEYDENGENHEEYPWNAVKDCGRVWWRTGDYYPMAGNLYPVGGSAHNYSSGTGYYWVAHEMEGSTVARSFSVRFNENFASYYASGEDFCYQLRCVKE